MTFLRISSSCSSVVVGDVLAGNDDASRVGLEKSHDVMQRNRLAHAATSEDADGFGGQHVEVDVVEHDIVAESFGDVAKFDVGRGLWVFVGHEIGFRRSASGSRVSPPRLSLAPVNTFCHPERAVFAREGSVHFSQRLTSSLCAASSSSRVFRLRNIFEEKPAAFNSSSLITCACAFEELINFVVACP